MAEHDRILGYFLEEAKDHLNTIEQGLQRLPETVRQPATIRELFRAAHSIKGSAAMLGLSDVQQVGDRFEANFKLLKEQPTITVDNKLQNLFLESFSFLRAAIEEVRTSSDPYRRDPASPDPVGDPVFEELRSYLQQLLQAIDTPTPDVSEQSWSQDPAVEQVFGEYVTRKLGEISSLCLQPDKPEIRAQIQQICQKLGSLGDNFDFLEWTNLFTGCRLAVANPHNMLHQLGESISIAVKQAQILILSDRHQSIGITPDLEALIDRKFSSVESNEANLDTLQLDQTEDPFAGNSTNNARPVPVEPRTLAPGLSSIYERVQPIQLEGGDRRLAEFAAVPEAEFEPGDNELDGFMQELLKEQMPNDGTWMQDDDFSGSDDFKLDFDLDEINAPPSTTSKADLFYGQMFEPLPPAASTPTSGESTKLPASEAIDYDEATFFTPDFGDSEDPDVATFWSDSPFDEVESPLYNIDGLDLAATAPAQQFQPERPLERLDVALPAFTLDDRPISEVFPTVTSTDSLAAFEPEQLEVAPVVDNFTDYSGEFTMDDFDEDLQLNETIGSINPFSSIGTMDTVEQGLATHEQGLGTHEQAEDLAAAMPIVAAAMVGMTAATIETAAAETIAQPDNEWAGTEVDFGVDILATAEASEDFFTDLDFSDSIELEPVGGSDNSSMAGAAKLNLSEANDWNGIVGDFDLGANDNEIEPAPISFTPEDFEPVPAVAAQTAADLPLTLATSPEDHPHLEFSTDIISAAVADSRLFEQSSDESGQVADLAVDGSDALTGWLDNYSDLHEIEDLSDLDLNSFGGPEPVADRSEHDWLTDVDLAPIDPVTPILTTSVPDLGVDLDFALLNQLEPVAALASDDRAAEPDLDLLNPTESVLAGSVDRNFDGFSQPEPVAALASEDLGAVDVAVSIPTPSIDDDFSEVDLQAFSDRESMVDLSFGESADLDLDFNLPESATNPAIVNDFTDLDVFNLAEPILPGSVDDRFINLDGAADENTAGTDLAFGDDFTNLGQEFTAITSDENISIEDDFANLDIAAIDENIAGADLAFGDNFANLSTQDVDLPIDVAVEQELKYSPSLEAQPLNPDFTDLDLSILNDTGSLAELSFGNDFLGIDAIGDTELVTNLSSGNDFANLDLDFNNAPSITELSIEGDFANLDLAVFNSAELIGDGSTNNDFANLDLQGISNNLSTDEFIDLGSILDTNPDANQGMGDLDALLLGTAAVGIGGAVAAGGSTFDDLDALMGSPSPTNDLSDLDGLLSTPAPAPAIVPTAEAAKPDRRSKQRTFEQTMRVSVRHLDNLNNLVGELVVNRNTLEQDQNRMRQFIEKLLSEVQKLNEVGKRMQDLYERSLMENSLIASRQQSRPQIPQAPASGEILDQTGALMEYDPLEMDRFTPIHLLSQKMIELTVRVRESTADIEFVVDGSTEVTRTLRQITGQLQEDLTKSRMIPFAQTADRLQRGVRDNGLKYGKQVELSIDGRDTLIDKVILESLTDPLIHMVNNAIAHGIESPETRLAAGKPALGTISVRALHQGNQTIISISDDGAGINAEIVKTKAIEKGIITAQQALTMTKAEVYDLLFLPSFSTKDQADELAGRGVGMDVVRTSLNEIRGTITTESQLGIGTTFTIRLPLALSIAKALIVVNNKNNIAFPMDGIEDTQDVSPEQIQTNSAGEQCIFWRDNLMPFKPLSDLLGFNRPLPRNNFYGTQEEDTDLVSILILRSDGNLIAVQVDRIIGDREIVIKPLQGPASKPLGIAGATVLGDGQIVPIADVIELIDLAKGTLVRHVSAQWSTEMILPTNEHHESMVLIVDDSITVRELLSLTFKRAGYRVEQARDGQEAWDKLRAGLPCDIVFCDIEMPRMDGLEFLSRVQKDAALSKVPVAMLTSRGSDRHRQIAAQLGASGYFIKPYLEEALLDAAKRMIKGEVLAIV